MYPFWKRGLASFQTHFNVCNNNCIEYAIIIYKQSIKIKIVFLRFKKDCYPVHLAHLSTVCLFGVSLPLENVWLNFTSEGLQIFTTYTRHLSSWRSEFSYSLLRLLWHRSSVYNCHLRGPATLTPVIMKLHLSLLFKTFFFTFLWSLATGDGILIFRMRGERSANRGTWAN